MKGFDSVVWNTMYYVEAIDDNIEFLDHIILELFNVYASIKTKNSRRPSTRWITFNIKCMMRLRKRVRVRFYRARRIEV